MYLSAFTPLIISPSAYHTLLRSFYSVQQHHPVSRPQDDTLYITIVDEVFILNICSYLIFFLSLHSLGPLHFIDVSFALRINDLYACPP